VRDEGHSLTATVLVVEDEEAIRFAISQYLEAAGYAVIQASTGRAAREAVRAAAPDVIILDYRLPDCLSVEIVPELKYVDPDCAIIVMTAHGSIDLAVEAIKAGAEQFITKPIELAALRVLIDRLSANRRTRKRDAVARARHRPDGSAFIGTAPAVRQLYDEARRVAPSDRPILLQGETGSGKGVLARWLHDASPRADEPFVDLNCAGLTRELLESELFGYERGAFTGAVAAKPGLLESAQHGTVFLDEIGDMDLQVQAKLLKVVEEKTFRRLGEVRDRKLDVRLICATHQDLSARARDGRFRTDLYFRISTFRLEVPPLRERTEDLEALVSHFIDVLARDLGRPKPSVSAASMAALRRYAWPGNIRELRNVVERALLLGDGPVIEPADLRFEAPHHAVSGNGGAATSLTLADMEKQHILSVLEEENGAVDTAAQRLGISRSSLYQKIKVYGAAPARSR
jgi:DNA-binding NtrC family response regulator